MIFVDLLSGCESTEGDGGPVESGTLPIDEEAQHKLMFGTHLNPHLLGSHLLVVMLH